MVGGGDEGSHLVVETPRGAEMHANGTAVAVAAVAADGGWKVSSSPKSQVRAAVAAAAAALCTRG